MTDWEIRALLRAATKEGILTGWQGPHLQERSYTIAPVAAPAKERSLDFTIGYCTGVKALGIQPLYRESEPR